MFLKTGKGGVRPVRRHHTHFKENSFTSDIGVMVKWVPSRLPLSREAGLTECVKVSIS